MNWKTGVSALILILGAFPVARPLPADRPVSRPHIFGFRDVTVFSSDLPATRVFYRKVLGMREDRCLTCERISGERFIINRWQSIVPLEPVPSPPPPTPSNLLSKIVFGTDNPRELRRYLTAQNIHVEPPIPKVHPKWDDFFFVTDPEGNRIYFAAGAPVPWLAPGEPPVVNGLLPGMHLIHVGFIVHDRAATEHFYKDILGFRPYWHGGMKDDETDWVSLQVPDGTDWIEFMVNVSPDADQRLRGIKNHIAIGVPDIHETEKLLKAAGAPVNEEPEIGRDGKWQLNVYDPDLTRVEFMEFKPVQKPCCSDFTGQHPGPQL